MSTTTATQHPTRKPSFLRHKIRESFRPSALRTLLDHSEKDDKHANVDGKRASMEEGSWIARKRRKSKKVNDEPKHTLGDLKIDVGGFEDLKASLDTGNEMYSLESAQTATTFATTATNETSGTVRPPQRELMAKLDQNQQGPIGLSFPQPMELDDTSVSVSRAAEPIAIPQQLREPVVEIRKGPKWQIKTDALVRPVSSGRANAISANVSNTIAAINKNKFQTTGKFSSPVDNMSSTRPSMESSRSKLTNHMTGTDKVDSVLGSNASIISNTYGNSRRPLGDTSRGNTLAANRHTVADVDKLLNTQTAEQENKRQSFPPVAVRRQSLINMHSVQQRPKSPTDSIASTATGAPRPRRPSGTVASQRLSWLKELEANSGKTPGQEYMLNKLSGGVAEKLRRFESQNSEPSGSSSRSQSATRGSEAYGIETTGGKRLSRTVTADEDFKKKLEEQFQRKKEDDEKKEKERKRVSLPAKTPQQIIDYAELNDRDREATIDDLTKDGKAAGSAKDLDRQAVVALKAQQASRGLQQPSAIFQSASSALKSGTSLMGPPTSTHRRFDNRGEPSKASSVMQSTQASKSTNTLQRAMSVQQARKQPITVKPQRPVSYAAVSTPIDDDYDPFNYASYPSRSSMYSNPPEAPAMTPEVELAEEDVLPVIKAEELAPVEDEPLEEPAKDTTTSASTISEELAAPNTSEASAKGDMKPEEVGKVEKASAPTPVEPPKGEAKPTPAATGWGARFGAKGGPQKAEAVLQSAGIKPTDQISAYKPVEAEKTSEEAAVKPKAEGKEEPKVSTQQSKLPIRGGPQKPAAVMASAAAAQGVTEPTEASVAQIAVPASPKLVDVVDRKKSAANSASSPAKSVQEKEAKPVSNDAPKSSLSLREASTSAVQPTTPKKQTPASLLLSNGNVKIASPCSSPTSTKEFNAAALPQLGTA